MLRFVNINNILGLRYGLAVTSLVQSNLANVALSFFQSIIVARVLGPDQFGAIALIIAYTNLFFGIIGAKTGLAVVKFATPLIENKNNHELHKLFGFVFTIAIILSSIALIISFSAAYWIAENLLGTSDYTICLILASFGFLFSNIVSVCSGICSAFGLFNRLAILQVLVGFIRFTSVTGLVFAGFGPNGYFFGALITQILSAAIFFVFIQLIIFRRTEGVISFKHFSLIFKKTEVWKFLFVLNYLEIIGVISKQLDILILGAFRPHEDVGYYRIARSLANGVGNFVGPLQSVLYQRLEQFVSRSGLTMAFQTGIQSGLRAGTPFAILVIGSIFVLQWIIPQVYGPEFSDAIFPAKLLVLGSAVWVGFFWLKPTYFATDKITIWAKVTTIMVLALLIGTLIIVPKYGVNGLALWLCFIQSLGHVILFFIIWKSMRNFQPTHNKTETPS